MDAIILVIYKYTYVNIKYIYSMCPRGLSVITDSEHGILYIIFTLRLFDQGLVNQVPCIYNHTRHAHEASLYSVELIV